MDGEGGVMEYTEQEKQVVRAINALSENNKRLTVELADARADLAVERRALEKTADLVMRVVLRKEARAELAKESNG